jgi:predicted RNA-binding Zn ribbon-like protein
MTASRSAAPGRLEVVRRFVNTRDIEASTDDLATPEALTRWLRDGSLLPAGTDADDDDLRRALELREALRDSMAANHSGAPVPPGAVAAINAAADRAGLALALTPDSGWVARPRSRGVDGALGEILALVARTAGEGTWRRLKVCVNDTCRWAFYDHSRAHTAKWCSMQVCGNRAKQQAWRSRHDLTQSRPASP